jgi:hypothetical protein
MRKYIFFFILFILFFRPENMKPQSAHPAGVSFDKEMSREISPYSPKVLYFPIDRYFLMRDYRINAVMLDALDSLMHIRQVVESIDTIKIFGACSPPGTKDYNLKLAKRRAQALKTYMRWKHPEVMKKYPVVMLPIGVDYEGYHALKNSGRKLTEKQRWNLLQYASIRFKMKDGSCIHVGVESPIHALVKEKGELKIRTEEIPRDTIIIYELDTIVVRDSVPQIEFIRDYRPIWIALKTNMLYDLALLPNLSAEVWLGKKMSIAANGYWSWWGNETDPAGGRHRIQAASLELRRWFFSPEPLRGHALGIYGLYGNYDLRLFPKDDTSPGQLSYESWSAGLSYAWSFALSKRFNMELGLAGGYVRGDYYDYNYCLQDNEWEPQDRIWKLYRRRNYWGPTRIGISIVWLIGTPNKTIK